MNFDQVRELIREHSAEHLAGKNSHRMNLQQALITPQEISVIERKVMGGRIADKLLRVWLVGQEYRPDGYRIIMCNDGSIFGLASNGFPKDEFPILVGWYGDLRSAFLNM